jgi:hypothetical protein
VLLYVGTADTAQVVDHYRRAMPQENWALVERSTSGITVLSYRKGEGAQHCDISIGRSNWLGRRTIAITVIGTNP